MNTSHLPPSDQLLSLSTTLQALLLRHRSELLPVLGKLDEAITAIDAARQQAVQWYVDAFYWSALGEREANRQRRNAEYRRERSAAAQQELACSS